MKTSDHNKWLILLILLGCVLVAFVIHWRAATYLEEDTSRRWTKDPENGSAIQGQAVSSTSRASRTESLMEQTQAGLQEIAAELNSPDGAIQRDLQILHGLLEVYHSAFGGNPVGLNHEITAALMGTAGTTVSMISSNHGAVNQKGELIDRWGMPFFFHQLSARQMEIRSAGPDREMWTEDDVDTAGRSFL